VSDWESAIEIDGVPLTTSGIGVTVDNDAGIFTFDQEIDEPTRVQCAYIWSAKVVLVDFQLQVNQQAHAVYNGSITVKRIPSAGTSSPWLPNKVFVPVDNASEW
jgi:hypothetical protein